MGNRTDIILKKSIAKILTAVLIILITGCGSSVRFTSKDYPTVPDATTNNDSDNSTYEEVESNDTDTAILETETGIASYYAHAYHGKQTSSGEIYDMYGISAAHPEYPPGTIVRVTNLDNNKSTILRINDHMPPHPDRIIDISYGAAKKLDMLQSGIAHVKVEVIKWGNKN